METAVNEYLDFKELDKFEHATLFTSSEKPKTLILRADLDYIPIEEFKSIFKKIGERIQKERFDTLVFDKRNLRIFHQPSMEWYFSEWKGEMAKAGLKNHYKLLPDDKLFRKSVQMGRAKIDKDFPDAGYHQTNIKYYESLNEAMI